MVDRPQPRICWSTIIGRRINSHFERTALNRGAMSFDSPGCEPRVTSPTHALNGGAVALSICPIREPMPSLRDSCAVGVTPTRGLHPWLSNDTAPPLKTNVPLPSKTNAPSPLKTDRTIAVGIPEGSAVENKCRCDFKIAAVQVKLIHPVISSSKTYSGLYSTPCNSNARRYSCSNV